MIRLARWLLTLLLLAACSGGGGGNDDDDDDDSAVTTDDDDVSSNDDDSTPTDDDDSAPTDDDDDSTTVPDDDDDVTSNDDDDDDTVDPCTLLECEFGCEDGACLDPPNTAPVAAFTLVAAAVHPLETVTFDATGTTDEDTATLAYHWDFGDGATATGAVVSHSYAQQGARTVTLSVTDSEGLTSTAQQAFDVMAYWTVGIYMAADNNLASVGLGDFGEIMDAMPLHPAVNVFLQAEFSKDYLDFSPWLDPLAAYGVPTLETARYTFPHYDGNDTASIKYHEIGDTNMSDPASLADFIQTMKAEHPAERYALVIWNHGAGWMGALQDLSSDGWMTLAQLGDALQQGGVHFDLINFDACLMAMYEVALVTGPHADLLVSSEDLEPAEGDPYDLNLADLNNNPAMTPAQFSQAIVANFHSFYEAQGRSSITKSSYDLGEVSTLRDSMNGLAQHILDGGEDERLRFKQSLAASQSYQYGFSYDLAHLLFNYSSQTANPAIQGRIGEIVDNLASNMVANAFYSVSFGSNLDASTGLATLIPGPNSFFAEGVRTLQQYESIYADEGEPWLQLVNALAVSPAEVTWGDFVVVLAWDDAVAYDLDLYLTEPDGLTAAPYLGPVSTNGLLSGESSWSLDPTEAWESKELIMKGDYRIYVNLYETAAPGATATGMVYILRKDMQLLGDPIPVALDLSAPVDPDSPTWLEDVKSNAYSNWKFLGTVTRPRVAPAAPSFLTNWGGQIFHLTDATYGTPVYLSSNGGEVAFLHEILETQVLCSAVPLTATSFEISACAYDTNANGTFEEGWKSHVGSGIYYPASDIVYVTGYGLASGTTRVEMVWVVDGEGY